MFRDHIFGIVDQICRQQRFSSAMTLKLGVLVIVFVFAFLVVIPSVASEPAFSRFFVHDPIKIATKDRNEMLYVDL